MNLLTQVCLVCSGSAQGTRQLRKQEMVRAWLLEVGAEMEWERRVSDVRFPRRSRRLDMFTYCERGGVRWRVMVEVDEGGHGSTTYACTREGCPGMRRDAGERDVAIEFPFALISDEGHTRSCDLLRMAECHIFPRGNEFGSGGCRDVILRVNPDTRFCSTGGLREYVLRVFRDAVTSPPEHNLAYRMIGYAAEVVGPLTTIQVGEPPSSSPHEQPRSTRTDNSIEFKMTVLRAWHMAQPSLRPGGITKRSLPTWYVHEGVGYGLAKWKVSFNSGLTAISEESAAELRGYGLNVTNTRPPEVTYAAYQARKRVNSGFMGPVSGSA